MSKSGLKINLRDMVQTAVFAAAICVVAPFSISIGPIPLSFATFIIYLAAAVLNWRYAVLSVLLYVALGAAGLPVFSGFSGGFHKIAGLTGGYIIGYIPCAFAAGLIIEVTGRKFWSYPAGMIAGTVLLYAIGTAWFTLMSEYTLVSSLSLCVIPFLPGDAIKIAVASAAAPRLLRAVGRFSTNMR